MRERPKGIHKKAVILPTRSRRYGVGKEIGGAIYLHRLYENVLGDCVLEAKEYLLPDFDYTVVKYDVRRNTVSFVQSPDFDTSPEPVVGNLWTIQKGIRSTFRSQAADPYIYHHKWLLVSDDYPGFSVEESKERSRQWLSMATIDFQRIGRLSYWKDHILPQLSSH